MMRKKSNGINRSFCYILFHETKNISCGVGVMLVVNDKRFQAKLEGYLGKRDKQILPFQRRSR
jgi:dTDP-4-amino-4,6-dideoxygalactose transaminase